MLYTTPMNDMTEVKRFEFYLTEECWAKLREICKELDLKKAPAIRHILRVNRNGMNMLVKGDVAASEINSKRHTVDLKGRARESLLFFCENRSISISLAIREAIHAYHDKMSICEVVNIRH